MGVVEFELAALLGAEGGRPTRGVVAAELEPFCCVGVAGRMGRNPTAEDPDGVAQLEPPGPPPPPGATGFVGVEAPDMTPPLVGVGRNAIGRITALP